MSRSFKKNPVYSYIHPFASERKSKRIHQGIVRRKIRDKLSLAKFVYINEDNINCILNHFDNCSFPKRKHEGYNSYNFAKDGTKHYIRSGEEYVLIKFPELFRK